MNLIERFLVDNKISYDPITNKCEYEKFRSSFGYYFSFGFKDSTTVFKIYDFEKVKWISDNIYKEFDISDFRRVKASEVLKQFSQKASKSYFGVELNTQLSFKNKTKCWDLHTFNDNEARNNWFENASNGGLIVKKIGSNERVKYTTNKKQYFYYAALNIKGVETKADDCFWKFYQFNNRKDRNIWVEMQNRTTLKAKQVRIADLYKLANIKYDFPIYTDLMGQIIINDSNRSTNSQHKYYFGVNRISLTSDCNNGSWQIYASESLKECEEMISKFNSTAGNRESLIATKVTREFAYSVLGLKSYDETVILVGGLVCQIGEEATITVAA